MKEYDSKPNLDRNEKRKCPQSERYYRKLLEIPADLQALGLRVSVIAQLLRGGLVYYKESHPRSARESGIRK